MIRRVMPSPLACLMLVIAIILGVGHSPAPAQQNSSLVFSTYLGGATPFVSGSSALTYAQNATCDAQGNIYVTGATTVSDLPVLNAYQSAPASGSTMSAFVAKYNPVGQPLWCTYLGGNNQSMGIGVAAIPNGGVAVMGLTTSAAPVPFPTTTTTAYQTQLNGQSDYFVTVFDANGKLLYSTYLGGSGIEGGVATVSPITFADDANNGNGLAVDEKGLIYVGGMTASSDFPLTGNAFQPNLTGSMNACLFIINPSQSGLNSLVYSSFLGGDRDNQGHSVAVNASGSLITVAGFTTSSTFPTTGNALRPTPPSGGFSSGSSNGFVTQFQSSQPGSQSSTYTMLYSTYLGGDTSSARDDVYGMTLDPTGLIVATGRTQSPDFPMTPPGVPTIFNSAPYLLENVSGDEPFLVKINPSLSGANSLVYSTFLGGGSATDAWGSFCTSVGVDSLGAVYVAGESNAQGEQYVYGSPPGEAPQEFVFTKNAFFTTLQGNYDAIFMQINPSGATLGYSTYLGGTLNDRTYGLAVDSGRNVVLTGLTFSTNFPLKNPAQTYPGNTNCQNAFITKFYPLSSQGIAPLELLLLLND